MTAYVFTLTLKNIKFKKFSLNHFCIGAHSNKYFLFSGFAYFKFRYLQAFIFKIVKISVLNQLKKY